VIVLHKLGKEELRVIVDLQLGRLRKMLAERRIDLELSPAALDLLIEHGYDPAFGARPLKRAIQRLVQDPLAREIIAGSVRPGYRMRAEREGDKLTFGKVTWEAAESNEAA